MNGNMSYLEWHCTSKPEDIRQISLAISSLIGQEGNACIFKGFWGIFVFCEPIDLPEFVCSIIDNSLLP